MKLLNYFKETIGELKKLNIPPKKEVYVTTAMIVATIVVFALLVMLSDFIISKIISLIFGL